MRPLKPTVTLAEAENWARELYGIDARARGLPGDVDRNFLLVSADGKRWVLKVAPISAVTLEIECQLAVLRFLASTDLGPMVPALVPDREGRGVGRVRTTSGENMLIRTITYLPGRPLATVDATDLDLVRQIGQTLGQLDRELERFDHPGAHRRHFWDLKTVLDLGPRLVDLAPELQPLVRSGLERFTKRILPHLPELPASVIHNDANDYNLLVESTADSWRLSGIIDFGDMVHTVTVAELAIASVYVMLGNTEPEAAATALVGGYESRRPLTDLERELLPDLRVARLCHSLLMCAQARATTPDDAYLRISEKPVAELLSRLQATP